MTNQIAELDCVGPLAGQNRLAKLNPPRARDCYNIGLRFLFFPVTKPRGMLDFVIFAVTAALGLLVILLCYSWRGSQVSRRLKYLYVLTCLLDIN